MGLADGNPNTPISPLGLSVLLVLGGVIWLAQHAWTLIESVWESLF